MTTRNEPSPRSAADAEVEPNMANRQPGEVLAEGAKPPDPSKAEGEDMASPVDRAPPSNRPPDPSKAEG